MKKILAVTLALATGSAFAGESIFQGFNAQEQQEGSTSVPMADQGVRHMIEFDAQSIPKLILGFRRTKTPGNDASSGTDLNFGFNYAYGIHRFLQAGVKFNYNNGLSGANDVERLYTSLGLIVNSNSDFTKAAYLSAFVGMGFDANYGSGNREDVRTATLALGKRMPLDDLGVKHVVYSPEIALTNINSTNDDDFEYSQSLEFRLLQFSVFF